MSDETATFGSETPRYWFRAKRYGWGWGLPCRWQGWAVLLGYLVSIVVSHVAVGREASGVVTVVGALVLLLVAMTKGEPPHWRWGG